MVVDDQQAVVRWMGSPAAHDGMPAEQIETHSAIVFLAGDRAWKLKRAVRYDYLDFSTVERRRSMCEAEVRLNRRSAPALYLGVVPVTRTSDGTLAIGGRGEPVDWMVEMRRFAQEDLCDRRAAAGALDLATVERLASAVAAFHRGAARRSDHGGRDAMMWVVNGNTVGFESFGRDFLDVSAVERVSEQARRVVAANGWLLDARRHAGFVRQCHGDLHLRNIVILDGQPTLFDGIEFNDELACIDVWYDLAFLLMDLVKRGLSGHANLVMNRYLAETGDIDGMPLLPLFLSCRAAIRAKTSATASTLHADGSRCEELRALSREYLDMAIALLQPSKPMLLAVGGFSGTGKSTIAAHLAPEVGSVPGAVVLRSDEIRKELAGVSRLSRLGGDAYSAEMSTRVYATLAERASRVLATGRSVIADAVYARLPDRDAIERAAMSSSVPFVGVWLEAPVGVLVHRATQRQHAGADPSDADARVVRMQLDRPVGTMRWQRVDASAPVERVVQQARAVLTAPLAPACPASVG